MKSAASLSDRSASGAMGADLSVGRRFFVLGVSALLFSGVAEADTPDATAEIMVLQASKTPGEGSIDPSIGKMPQLKKPPLDKFNTYKLLDKKGVTLKKGAPSVYPLVNGHKLELVLLEKTTDTPARFRIGGSIRPPKGEAFLKKIEVNASANEPFFVAGQSHNGGILVLGITVR